MDPFLTLDFTEPAELARILTQARAAQREWCGLPPATRVAVVAGMVSAFRSMADRVALDITRQTGKPLQEAFQHLTRPKSFHLRSIG